MVCAICKEGNLIHQLDAKDYRYTKEVFSVYTCENCKIKQTKPIPQNIKKYYNIKDYDSYNTKKDLFGWLYGLVRRVNSNSKLLTIKKEGVRSLLDYGCGSGHFVKYARQKGLIAFGYEPINQPDNKYVYKKLNEVPEKKYDLITLWHVLEHTKDPVSLILSLKKLLNEGGKIIIGLPNYDSYDNFIYKSSWAGYDLPRHIYHFNRSSFAYFVEKTQMKIIKTKPMIFDSFYVSMLSEQNKNNPFWFLFGFINGLISNLLGLFSKNYSSIIYIIK